VLLQVFHCSICCIWGAVLNLENINKIWVWVFSCLFFHYQKIGENQWNYRRIFFRWFLPMDIILSLLLPVYTDRPLLTVIITDGIDSVGDAIGPSVYIDRIADRIYRILKRRDSVMTGNCFRCFYRRNDREIQTRISV